MFKKKKRTHTRKISPKLGIMGLLGFMGFLGFIPDIYDLKDILPVPTFFIFFAFFGFFGFYYEGKMSDTLIDERFESNAYRAAAIGNRISLCIIIIVAIFSMSIFQIMDAYTMSSILIATIGFSFGLSIFLQQFLLYRFENED